MVMALEGLARRGHVVTWTGHPDAAQAGGRDPEGRTQVVVGGVDRPLRTALTGWLAGAQVMLLDLRAAGLDRWGWLDRWAWGSLYGAGLVDEVEAAGLAANPRGLDRERIGLWPGGTAVAAPDPAHPDVEVLERACERALARHHGGGARAAVFLDRDGTLVRETGYLSDPDGLELLPGVAGALRDLAAADLPLVVISNQSGIGRGMFREADVHAVMARLRARLREQGVELSAVYFCPHRPEDGCACRKPRTGLLERAAEDLGLSPGASVMIGDKRIDAATGRRAGGHGILVRTGYGREEERRADVSLPAPDHIADDLPAAAAWWLDRM
jgi:histidinol-phosphate phosphatase family protein